MQDPRGRFRRKFALISTIVTLAAAIGVGALTVSTYWNMLMALGERRHAEIAEAFYEAARERAGPYLDEVSRSSAPPLRGHPKLAQLTEIAQAAVRGSRAVRLAIYDQSGRIIFSTQPDEIGRNFGDTEEFRRALAGEHVSSRDARAFKSVDGTVIERKIFSSFVRIPAADGTYSIIGLHSDMTGYEGLFVSSLMVLVAVVVGALFTVLGMLTYYVWRDRTIADQLQQNLDLTKAAEVAEEASRLKSRFVASMGHELRTPLNAIIGFSEIMAKRMFGPLGSAKYEDYARSIHSSGRHLLAVVSDVLDMARIEGGKAILHEAVFPLRPALLECAQVATIEAERAGLEMATDFAPDLPNCSGDEAKIKQIVYNLLSNAVRYTPKGGKVMFSARMRGDGALAITVTDNGIGIAPDQLAHVFDAFRQADDARVRKAGGLGLGLNIAKAFSDLHGADLTLGPMPGGGTIAALVLPRTRLIAPVPAGIAVAA